jgi:23S rRNA pseudouridine2605 synthase
MQERLQKILAQAGVASRRAAEKLIANGRVTVNGETVCIMGTKADPAQDDIRVDGRRLRPPQRIRYILLNKPAGFVTTRLDPQRRPTVIDLLRNVHEYVYPVGRLDYDSEGLLLLTNDGDLAARLTHPRHGVERVYEVRVAGAPNAEAVKQLRKGIVLDGRRTLPADVVLLSSRRDREGALRLTIREGRNRQVRRMCEAIGHPVRALRRVRIGPVGDSRLKAGQWRELTPEEVQALREVLVRPPTPRPRTERADENDKRARAGPSDSAKRRSKTPGRRAG